MTYIYRASTVCFHWCLEFTERVLLGYFNLGVTVPIYRRKRFQKVERFTQAHTESKSSQDPQFSLTVAFACANTCPIQARGWG